MIAWLLLWLALPRALWLDLRQVRDAASLRRMLERAVLLWRWTYATRRARRMVRRSLRRHPWAVGLEASIASPIGMGNDGKLAYDLATRTWFGAIVGQVFANTGGYVDVGTGDRFGTKANGIANDDNALALAIASLPSRGGILRFGSGVFNYQTGLTDGTRHIRFVGEGRDMDNTTTPPTVLQFSPTAAGNIALLLTSHGSTVEDLLLTQGNATATTKGIQRQGVFGTTLRQVTVTGFTAAGITDTATSTASAIWNSCIGTMSRNNTIGLDLVGVPAQAKVANNNTYVASQFTGNAVASPNVRFGGGTSENGFYGCDVTGGNAQTLVQGGDGVNTCRGNIFWSCTAEGGGGGGTGFNLAANSSMWWISAECTSTTKVAAAAGVTYLFWDHVGNVWSTGGNIGVNFDPAGGLAMNAATQGANTFNGLNNWLLMAAGTSLVQLANNLITMLKDVSLAGHLLSSAAGTPATSNLGANVTSVTFTGNDTRGKIAVVMSGALAANTRIATCTYAVAFGAAPGLVMLVNETSAVGLTIVNFYPSAEAAGSFDLFSDQALAAGTYTLRYLVIG